MESKRPVFVRAALVSAVLTGITLLGLYYWFSGTPRYSSWKIKQAVANRDVETFEQYVDLEEIASRLVEKAFDKAMEQYRKDTAENPFAGLGAAIALLMKPTVKEAAQSMVKAETTKVIEEGILSESSFDLLDIRSVEQEGRIATVELARTDGQPIWEDFSSFTLIMRQTQARSWKIVELPTMDHWMRSILEKPIITRVGANERNIIGRLRTFNTAFLVYKDLHPELGFPRSLEELKESELVGDSGYPLGESRGYKYTYSPMLSDGRVTSYTLIARPEVYGKTGERSFFTDESGVIRYTKEDRPATPTDPKVR